MNKRGLIDAIVEKEPRVTKKDVGFILATLPSVFKDELTRPDMDGKIYIKNIGTFSVKYVPPKKLKLISGDEAGKVVDVSETYTVKFKPSKYIKEVMKEAF